MTESPRFRLNDNDVKKIGTGLVLAIAGAVITFFVENTANMNLGEYAPFVAAIASVVLNIIRKYVKGDKSEG